MKQIVETGQSQTNRKVVFEGHYIDEDRKESYREPIGGKHMFRKGTNINGQFWHHIGVSELKSCANEAINMALRDISNGGYLVVEVTVKNP